MKLISILLALCPLALADISFVQPSVGTVWTAGNTGTIQWQYVNGSSAASGPVTVNLIYGATSFPQFLGSATVNNGNTVAITVPTDLPTGSKYVVQANGTSSPFFTVQNSQLPAGSAMPLNVTLVVVSVSNSTATNSSSAASALQTSSSSSSMLMWSGLAVMAFSSIFF